MMTLRGNAFCIISSLWAESTGNQWIYLRSFVHFFDVRLSNRVARDLRHRNVHVALLILIGSSASPLQSPVIKWKHVSRYWQFVSPVHKGQWHRALMFSLICASINGWVNNPEAGDLGRNRAHYDAIVLEYRPRIAVSLKERCRITNGSHSVNMLIDGCNVSCFHCITCLISL